MVPGKDEFVSVGDDGTMRHWSISRKRMLRTIQSGSDQLHAVAISPDGKWLATGNPTLELWDFAKGEKVRELSSNDVTLESIAFAPDGKSVAAAWRYDEVHVVGLDGTMRGSLPPTQLRNETLVFSRDGSELFVPYLTERENLIRQWPIDSSNESAGVGKGELIWSRIAVSHDDLIPAVVTSGGHVRFIDNATDRIVGILVGQRHFS